MSKQGSTKQNKNPFAAGITLLALLLSASCSQEDTILGGGGDRFSVLGLSAVQANDLSEETAATRATATVYSTSKLIGFFVKENTANGYTACNNRKGAYNSVRKLWLPTPDSIWLNNHDADIAVYAPYDAAHTTAATLNLAAALRPANGSKDIWCKKFAANNKSTNLAPILEHVYTRFTISMKLDANYKGTAPVDSVSLVNDSLYAVGAFRPFETAAYKYEGEAGIGFKIAPIKTLTTAAPTATVDLLLIPATLTADIKLGITVNGITFGVKIASSRFAGKLQAGKQYNASVTLKPTALEVTSVTINDWNDETVSGEQEPVFGLKPIEIASLGFLVAPANLTATKMSDGSYVYDFANSPASFTAAVNGGDFFCWNTLDPTNITAKETAWIDARDACRQVGAGWRTPTKAEFLQIVGLPTYWGTWKKADGTLVKGRYYGIASQPADTERYKYVFLPASGERYSSGSVGNLSAGYYWTTTDRCALSQSETGSFMGVNPDYGFALRCVRNK